MGWSEVPGVELWREEVGEGISSTVLARGSYVERFITAAPASGEPGEALFRRVGDLLEACGAEIVALDGFGDSGCARAALARVWGEAGWPVTWVEEACGAGRPLGGIQVWGVSGARVERILREGVVVGTVFEDAFARYGRLGGLPVGTVPPGPGNQAGAAFEQMAEILHGAGMDFGQVVRTWFNNTDILSWYDVFNAVRTAFFEAQGVLEGVVPASTGVGRGEAGGAALVSGLLAVQPKGEGVSVGMVPSPLQGAALDYGSSFSRAVDVVLPDCRRLLVSGTASIEPDGETAHGSDVAGQIGLTLDVVEAILDSRGLGWGDVSRAIAYFKRAGDMPAWDACCADRGLPPLPVLRVNNDICREDLLFEIEVDAIQAL